MTEEFRSFLTGITKQNPEILLTQEETPGVRPPPPNHLALAKRTFTDPTLEVVHSIKTPEEYQGLWMEFASLRAELEAYKREGATGTVQHQTLVQEVNARRKAVDKWLAGEIASLPERVRQKLEEKEVVFRMGINWRMLICVKR